MQKPFLLILGLLLSSWAFSQSTSPEVISTSRDHFSGSQAQLSWTLGETMIATFSNDRSQLSQGFHQTNLMVTAIEDLSESLQIKVYPNPVADLLQVEWSESIEPISLRVLDAGGRQLHVQQVGSQPTPMTLDFSGYSAGSYYLHLYQQDTNRIKTFTILKHKQT